MNEMIQDTFNLYLWYWY